MTVAWVLTLLAAPAIRGEEAEDEIYELRPVVDGAWIALAATFSAAWVLRNDSAPAWCAPDCRAFENRVNSFDGLAAGNWSRGWSNAADAVVYLAMAGSALTLAIDGGGLPDALEELVTLTQAIVFANALSVVAQTAGGRPRPYLYTLSSPLEKRERGDGDMSFHSGHTATTFAATVVVYDALHRRHPDGPAWLALAAGIPMGVFVAVGRALSGQHFPTDTMLSAVLGTACGLLVTRWHALPVGVSSDGTSVSLSARF